MSNMNSRTRQKLRRLLARRDGKTCNNCGAPGDWKARKGKKQLIIDHIDNDNSNNDLPNLQLLCRRHNYMKNPRGSKQKESAVSALRNTDMPATMKKNLAIEKKAKEWMKATIIDDVRLERQEVIQRLAFVTDASVITIDRWLQKSVVNEEPACRYRSESDDNADIWIELKPEYRKVQNG